MKSNKYQLITVAAILGSIIGLNFKRFSPNIQIVMLALLLVISIYGSIIIIKNIKTLSGKLSSLSLVIMTFSVIGIKIIDFYFLNYLFLTNYLLVIGLLAILLLIVFSAFQIFKHGEEEAKIRMKLAIVFIVLGASILAYFYFVPYNG